MTRHDYDDFVSPLPHPGALLREDYLSDYSMTAGDLAAALGLPDASALEGVLREAQPITAELALRLCRVFGTTARYWINLQTEHDLSKVAIDLRNDLALVQQLPFPKGCLG